MGNEIRKIEDLFKHEKLAEFYSNYEKLISNRSNSRNYTYWGVNFKDEKVFSIKFYAHLFDEMTTEELLDFIPTTKDFEKFVHLKQTGSELNVNNVGIALELKLIIGSSETRHGFYYMLKNTPEAIGKVGFPERLPLKLKEKCKSMAVNFEYEGSQKLFKKYYYFKPEDCESFFEEKFNTQLMNGTNLIEYSESETFSKINIFGTNITSEKVKCPCFTSAEMEIINYFNDKYGFINLEYGMYDNDEKKSIYFFSPSLDGKPFSTNKDTLKKIICE